MQNISKKYLVWNYSAVILLTIVIAGAMLDTFANSRSYYLKECIIFVIIWSVIWICIIPMFVKNLAKGKRLKQKFWFIFSIITALLPIIAAIICSVLVYTNDYYDDPSNAYLVDDLGKIVFFSTLLPILSFLVFWLCGFFKNLDWSTEDDVRELSQNPNLCPHCNSPIDADSVFCENCGNKIK